MKQFGNRRAVAAAAVSASVLVPLGAFGAPALARSVAAASQYGGSSQYQYKVAICHRTHSKKHPFHVINVSSHAVKAHLRHGDTLAPCPAAPLHAKHDKGHHGRGHHKDAENGSTTTTATTTTTTSSGDDDHGHHGDDHGHGHGKGHGK